MPAVVSLTNIEQEIAGLTGVCIAGIGRGIESPSAVNEQHKVTMRVRIESDDPVGIKEFTAVNPGFVTAPRKSSIWEPAIRYRRAVFIHADRKLIGRRQIPRG